MVMSGLKHGKGEGGGGGGSGLQRDGVAPTCVHSHVTPTEAARSEDEVIC